MVSHNPHCSLTPVCTEQLHLDCTSSFSSPSLLFLQVFSCVLEHFWLPPRAVLNTMSWQLGTVVAMCAFALCMVLSLSFMGTDVVAHAGHYIFANSWQGLHSVSLLGLKAWECESGFVSLYPFRQFLNSIAASGLFNIYVYRAVVCCLHGNARLCVKSYTSRTNAKLLSCFSLPVCFS